MKRIYEVKFKEQLKGNKDWFDRSVRVVGGEDAQKAIDAVKRKSLSDRSYPTTGFRLTSVAVAAETTD